MKSCKHCVISGRVQGVFFRQGTYEKAKELGVSGWVRNLDGGEVECVLCGDLSAVEALCVWLKEGPPAAKVLEVKVTEIPLENFEDFSIRR